jgi:hypothetical protein
MDENALFSPHFHRRQQSPKPLSHVVPAGAGTRESVRIPAWSNFIAPIMAAGDIFSRKSIAYGAF